MSRARPVVFRLPAAASAALAALAAASCGQDQPRGDPLKGGEARPAVEGPAMPGGGELPPGHPPLGAAPGGAAPLPAAPELTWTVPEGWTASKPSSAMRMAQFDLPGEWPDGGGKVQCVLFSLMAGGTEGNLSRWKGQIPAPGGASQDDLAKVTTTERDGFKVSRIEMTGAFTDSMTQPPKMAADAMFLGAVLAVGGGDAVYTVKLAGPRAVVEPQKAAFDAFLDSIRPK